MTSVTLCMIVKNEARVIERCLDSVRPFVDAWSICDTGSTDGTQDIIRRKMADLPGQLHERPWVDQQHNRNDSIDLARPLGGYLLLLDADETIETDPGFEIGALGDDCYDFTVRMEGMDCEFPRPILVHSRFPWRWRGKRHPGLYGEGARNPGLLRGIYVRARADGASWSNPEKYRQHVADMEAEAAAAPDDPRIRYYLAQSYRDAGMIEQALAAYQLCATMGEWPERKWSALYEAAKLRERLGHPMPQVVCAYLAAVEIREHRAEPLYQAARYLRCLGRPEVALVFAREAAALPKPDSERMFVEPSIYAWRALDEYALCAYFAGEIEDAQDAIARLREVAPDAVAARITRNAVAIAKAAGIPK